MFTNNLGVIRGNKKVAEKDEKRKSEILALKLTPEEWEKWDALVAAIRDRITIANSPTVLRDILFGKLNLVTPKDMELLKGEPAKGRSYGIPLMDIANSLRVPLTTVVDLAQVYDKHASRLTPDLASAILKEIIERMEDRECCTG
jgi:hypothetical protein